MFIISCLAMTLLAMLLIICSGCSGDQLLNILVRSNCQQNANPKVTQNRRVTLFVKHHIVVGGEPQADGSWNPDAESVHPYFRGNAKIKNSEIVKRRTKQIREWVPIVNTILKKNGANIGLLDNFIDVLCDPEALQGNLRDYLNASGHTAEVMDRLRRDDPSYVHVLWCWTSPSPIIGLGKDFVTVIADDTFFNYGDKADELTLAHEIVHALGFIIHHPAANNLMNDPNHGEVLTTEQIDIIWHSINTDGARLASLTCDK